MGMRIYSGTSNRPLAEKICKNLLDKYPNACDDLKNLSIERFKDGEILPKFKRSIRGEDVFFVQTTNTHSAIWETLLVLDAAKRSECKSFTLIAPFQGYSRQDKNDHLRSSIGARVLADTLTNSGITRLITIDLHASQIQGFYPNTVPVVHLNGSKIFTPYIQSLNIPEEQLAFVGPDMGASERNRKASTPFPHSTLAIIDKRRVKPNEIESMRLIGDVEGKHVFFVDDMADTLGTLKKAAALVMEKGALSARGFATHAVLSGQAMENLEDSMLTEVVVSDSIDRNLPQFKSSKLKILSCSTLISDVVDRLLKGQSIAEINDIVPATVD